MAPLRPWLVFLIGTAACRPVDSSGDIFRPVDVERRVPAEPPPAEDPAFATEPEIHITSEQMANGTVAPAEAAGVDVAEVVPGPEPAPAAPREAAEAAPVQEPVGVPGAVQWPVRLVSTVPEAQPPRAILGLPSGEERVVTPGSMLVEQGLVVVSVSRDRVTLAKVQPAGDHARIETLELVAQYGR